jgi:hypothetical protein
LALTRRSRTGLICVHLRSSAVLFSFLLGAACGHGDAAESALPLAAQGGKCVAEANTLCRFQDIADFGLGAAAVLDGAHAQSARPTITPKSSSAAVRPGHQSIPSMHLIAATALIAGAAVVTWDTDGFAGCGLIAINLWWHTAQIERYLRLGARCFAEMTPLRGATPRKSDRRRQMRS